MKKNTSLRTPIPLEEKKILFIAPHPDDDAIGCGAFLFYLSKIRSGSINIAYAVSGFNGISDCFLKKKGFLTQEFLKESPEQQRELKSEIRRKEADLFCTSVGAKPVFWNLPFYEEQKKTFTQADVEIASSCIGKINPDIIFLIDEESDPHGTHGMVRNIVLQALQEISFDGLVVGYRVWDEFYKPSRCDILLSFDEAFMKEKKRLISLYKSQMQDPAFPCKYKNFIELAKHTNLQIAKDHECDLPYAECYKIFDDRN